MAYQFPDPSITTEYTAPNGTEYKYDPIDQKWVPVGFVDPILPETDDDNLQAETTDDRYVNIPGDTLTGDLTVLDPVDDLSAVTKVYVDNSIIGDFLVHDGDTMEGLLEVPTPIEDSHVVNIEYVDIVVDDLIYKLGDEMTGTLGFESDPTDLEPVVYKFSPCIVELKDGSGDTTTTLDLKTDHFKINTFLNLKDDGEFTFTSPVGFKNFIISETGGFNLNDTLEVHRGTEDHISYSGPIEEEKEIVTKEYVDRYYIQLTSSIPVGSIFFWVSTQEPPDIYFKLDGSSFDVDEYVDLHNYLLGTNGYTRGVLPNYDNRYLCHIGNKNNGSPGQPLTDKNKFTGTTNSVAVSMVNHKHGMTQDGKGSHTHTWTVATNGTHTHTYEGYSDNKDGGKVGTNKNPYEWYPNSTMSTSRSHTHTVSLDPNNDHDHTHTVTVDYGGGSVGRHNHYLNDEFGSDDTTRPLSFVGYWIIKNK